MGHCRDLDEQMSEMHLNFSAEHLVLKEKADPPASRFTTALAALEVSYFSVAMGELVSSEHMDEMEEMMVAKTIRILGRFSEKHQCYQGPAMDLSYVDPCVQQFGPNLDEKTIISFLEDFISKKTLGKKQIKNETVSDNGCALGSTLVR